LVKRLKIDDNRLYLFSENDKYPPYEVHETDDFNILGIVNGLAPCRKSINFSKSTLFAIMSK